MISCLSVSLYRLLFNFWCYQDNLQRYCWRRFIILTVFITLFYSIRATHGLHYTISPWYHKHQEDIFFFYLLLWQNIGSIEINLVIQCNWVGSFFTSCLPLFPKHFSDALRLNCWIYIIPSTCSVVYFLFQFCWLKTFCANDYGPVLVFISSKTWYIGCSFVSLVNGIYWL